MQKKIGIIFLISFLISYFLLQSFSHILINRQEAVDAKQTRIIQENIKDRFRLFLNVPLTISVLGANLFGREGLNRKYSDAAHHLIDLNPEILGLNVVNKHGEIIRIFPELKNPGTLGKLSQNFEQLKESYAKGEAYYFSEPFKLYQGKRGFAMYVPIIAQGQLQGWMATVIDADLFFKGFKLLELSSSYAMIIKDKTTGKEYFATATEPQNGTKKTYETTIHQLGRDLVFMNWRIDNSFVFYPEYGNFFIAFIIAIIAGLITKLYEQRKKAREQLRDISSLLTLTSKEALSNLVEIHSEFNQLEPKIQKPQFSRSVNYLTNLIEQIDLLQTMAQAKIDAPHEIHNFLPLLQRQLEVLSDVIEKKDLTIEYGGPSLEGITINANGWLIQNSVLSNILSHAIIYAQNGSQIRIENQTSDETNYISFHVQKVISQAASTESLVFNRRMEVAKRILHIYQGELLMQNDLSEGMIIRILLPQYQA